MAEKDMRLAVRRLLRLDDGTVGFVYVDALTGDVLDDLNGYYLKDANGTPAPAEQVAAQEAEEGIPEEVLSDKTAWEGASGGTVGTWESRNRPEGLSNIGKIPFLGKPLGKLDSAMSSVGKKIADTATTGINAVKNRVNPKGQFPDAPKSLPTPVTPQINTKPISSQLPEDDENYFQDIPSAIPFEDTLKPTDVSQTARKGDGSSLGIGMGKDPDLEPVTDGIIRNNSLVDLDNMKEPAKEMLSKLDANTGEPITVLSGYRSKEYNDKIYRERGKKPTNSTHTMGMSFDISLEGMSDEEKTETIQRAIMSGAKTVGVYPSGNSVHVDTTQRYSPLEQFADKQNGVTAMYNYSRHNYASAPDWFKKGVETAPVSSLPETRPDTAFADDKNKTSQEPVLQTFAKQMVQQAKGVDFKKLDDLSEMTPAEFQTTIYQVQRDDKERADMALTIAGEMTPSQLQALREGDPVAKNEFAAIMSSIENRAFSEKLNPDGEAGLDDVLIPSQYNSLMETPLPNGTIPMEVTKENYNMFGDTLLGAVDDYYNGVLDITQPKATHYAANYIDPSWSPYTTDGMNPVGEHSFAELLKKDRSGVEYAPSSSFLEARDKAVDTYSYDVINSGTDFRNSSSLISSSPLENESRIGRINNQVSSSSSLDNSSLLSSAPDMSSYNSGTTNSTGSRNPSAIGSMDAARSYNSGTSGQNSLGTSSSGSGAGGYTASTGGNYSTGTGSSGAAQSYSSSDKSISSGSGYTASTGGNYSTGTGSSGAAQSYSSSSKSKSSSSKSSGMGGSSSNSYSSGYGAGDYSYNGTISGSGLF